MGRHFTRRFHEGFTLLEIVVTLILVGIMATFGGMAIVSGMKGYAITKNNSAVSQKAQLAMTRLIREVVELEDITAAASSTTLSIHNVSQGDRSIGLDGSTLKIGEGVSYTSGDTLVDGVSAFTLTYYSGNTTYSDWPLSRDITLLSAIEIDLRLTRPGGAGGTLDFATRAAPRNNRNTGGGTPPSSGPPTKPDYGCFVATAACGDQFHPMVVVLKDFRERFLLTHGLGRWFVRCYNTAGPVLAGMIKERPHAAAIVRWLLFPVVCFAILMLTAPWALCGAILCLCLLAFHALLFRFSLRILSALGATSTAQRGSVLITVIVTIVALGALGAAMIPLFSSSLFTQAYSDQGRKAFFLAESGFRYAASLFLNAGSDSAKLSVMQNDLHGQTYMLLDNGGSFSFEVYPYWFKSVSASGPSLTTRLYGGYPPDLSLSSRGGLKIGASLSDAQGPFEYSSGSNSGTTVTFTRRTGNWPNIASGTDVHLVALSSNSVQTVTEGGDLGMRPNRGGMAFPLKNGNFTLEPAPAGTQAGTVYNYEKRDGNTLEGISLAEGSQPWTNLNVTAQTGIVLEKFLQLSSTGIAGDAQREILYNVPIGWMAGSELFKKEEFHEPFDTLQNWSAPEGEGAFGGEHSIQSVDGDNALSVDSAPFPSAGAWWSGSGRWSILFFNWWNTNTHLAQSWMDAKGMLSYDMQVKVRAQGLLYYSAGMGFRGRNNSANTDFYTYGVNFMRGKLLRWKFRWSSTWSSWSEDSDIADDLIPPHLYYSDPATSTFWPNLESDSGSGFLIQWEVKYSNPGIVLWQRTAGGFEWLACRLLSDSNHVVNGGPHYRFKDWSTLMVRVVEGFPLSFTSGGTSPVVYGDTISNAAGSASARVVGTPLVSSGSWAGGNAQGVITISNVEGTFSTGDSIRVGGVNLGTVVAQGASKANWLRVYYGDTSAHGTAGSNQLDDNRLANPRDSVDWPPDDVTDVASSNDCVTLVQWDDFNTGVSAESSSSEPGAVILTNTLSSPDWTSTSTVSDFDPAEGISLLASGDTATSLCFDDYAIQLDLKAGTGFLPPVQQ